MPCMNNFSLNELAVAIARGNISTEIKINKDSSRYLVCYLGEERKEVYKIIGPKDYMVFSAILHKIGDAVACYSCEVFGMGNDMEDKVCYNLGHILDNFRECDALIPYKYFSEDFATDFKYMHLNDKNRDLLLSCDDSGRNFEFYFNLEDKSYERFSNMYSIFRASVYNHDLRSFFRCLKFFDELGGQKRLSVPEVDLRMWTDYEVLFFCLLLQPFNRSWVKNTLEKRFSVKLVK